MPSRARTACSLLWAIMLAGAVRSAVGQSTEAVREPDAGLTASGVVGLYQMLDPRGYADPLTAATYLRLLPDGRSRLEGVVVSDVNGAINSEIQVGKYHRTPWAIRRTAAGPELCFDVAGKSQCAQVERDLGTNDLLLYDPKRPRGRADLRLHRVGSGQTRTRTD